MSSKIEIVALSNKNDLSHKMSKDNNVSEFFQLVFCIKQCNVQSTSNNDLDEIIN